MDDNFDGMMLDRKLDFAIMNIDADADRLSVECKCTEDVKMAMNSRQTVFNVLDEERNYQNRKFGEHHDCSHPPMEFIAIMEKYLALAKADWFSGGDQAAQARILEVVAVGVSALEHNDIITREDGLTHQEDSDG